MVNLPAELVCLISGDSATSAALALANKYYNYVFTPILYGRATLTTFFTLEAFTDALATSPPLREYPTSLHLSHYPDSAYHDAKDLNSTIRKLLMHVPNLIDLRLTLNPPSIRYLLAEPHYPFMLRSLRMVPTKDALFIEFLKSQPYIEYLTLMPDSGDADLYFTPGWHGVPSPLDPHILPNLKSIESDKVNVSFLVPYRPVTNVALFHFHKNLDFHQEMAKSSSPLERLSERIELWEIPWETGIISLCSPSLAFCQASLREYSLELVATDHRLITHSVYLFLRSQKDGSHGLESIRNSLSTFSALEKFSLIFHTDWYNDLTPEFCEIVPELSRIDVWKESCPSIEKVTLFGILLEQ